MIVGIDVSSEKHRIKGRPYRSQNGKVDYIRNKPFGMLIVILRGEDAERKKALEYISKNVYKLERLGGR